MAEEKGARRRGPKAAAGAVATSDVRPSGADATAIPDDGGKGIHDKPRGGQVYRGNGLAGTTPRDFLVQNLDHGIGLVYTLLSFWTRFYRIGHANNVVWDEAHFGKFATHYIKREFYFDVHPPLGKMLVALAGWLAGYDGSFEFKSGEQYPEDVPYTAMRMILATFGVSMVPLGWYTAIELGMSRWACHLVAMMVLFDVGWLCISRFILLDSMLLFFVVFTVFCLTKFHNQKSRPFSIGWWSWLTLMGLGIGCVTSVKMVGMFVTALVGLYTVEDLWEKFGDLKMTAREQVQHWVARVACLIVLPILVFIACFKIHFIILNETGPGDAQMSSLFQATLEGNVFGENPLEIAFGSRVSIKNMGFGGGLLHSHPHQYPTGSNQQQVTCYHHKDANNDWDILPRWEERPYDPEGPIRFLQHNDVIRLSHSATTRNMHSHPIPAPITKLNHEVSCYGNSTIGDIHDYWVVEVVDDALRGSRANVDKIHALTTRMRFRHQVLGCYLRAATAMLPQWGWKQAEVSCVPENNPRDTHTYWNVEQHVNPRLPPYDFKGLKSPFLRDFWHLNVAMMNSNNALIPDPDKEDILASDPFDWPFMHLGLRMCGWGDNQVKYYLIGNPIVWWGGATSLIVGLVTLVVYLMRMQRQYFVMDDKEWEHFLYVGKVAVVGWTLHYVPFIIMGRVTYVHHYASLPTLYFAVLMFAHILDHFIFSSRTLPLAAKGVAFGICAGAVAGTFWWFKGVAFGIDGPINEHWGLLWRKTWNIYNLQ
ncbi:Glycosyltransferase family 39 protein [Mycena sanguinolenta]|uniref:Dolichyl-phosphate-mannose--protein mannosyltransferase n=1 Tax=Mycena sanguinolenta TaxID=230812 RepID=A0A8H6ZFF4_9AGAR|nr:Glycosyltransferase family 39 protein [Mycena sanguinolenta]